MTSKKAKSVRPAVAATRSKPSGHIGAVAFYPLVVLTLVVWFIYRALFHFPVWFDESVGKAIFFGLPVWLYVSITQSKTIIDTFEFSKFKRGVLLGLAFGGCFGFAASLLSLAKSGNPVETALLFSSDAFWWEFLLSLLTGFWETVFFFCWIMVVIQEIHRKWPLIKQVMMVSLIFTLFHIPNSFLRFSPNQVAYQVLLMFAFGVGQAFIFSRRQNGYTLTLSHAIWGMVLLIHM